MSEAVRQPAVAPPLTLQLAPAVQPLNAPTASPASAAAVPLHREHIHPPPATIVRTLPRESTPESSDETDDSDTEHGAAGSDTDSDDSTDSVASDHYPLAAIPQSIVPNNARVLSVSPTRKLPAIVAQRAATAANLVAQQHPRVATTTTTAAKSLTANERLALANPCQFMMVGNKTVDQSLGWRFREAVLANLKPTIVAQDMASAAVGSKAANQSKGGGVGESILSVGGSAASVVGGENDQNIEPRFINSQHLTSSLLIPADRQRQNTRSIFEVHQRDSHIWRLLIETKSPKGVRYYYEAWVKWKPVVGADAIQDRFHMLAVFKSQRPSLTLPAHCGPTISERDRRRTVREQIFARLCAVRTKNFPALVGSSWLSWFSIRQCTLNNLIAQKTHLRQLFEETPNATTLTIGDFILLFEYDPIAAEAESSDSKKRKNKNGSQSAVVAISSSSSSALMSKKGKEVNEHSSVRFWLRKLHYSPKLHFTFPGRCPVGVLTMSPYLLKWKDMRPSNSSNRHSFIKEYKDIGSWPAFFSPIELASLKFSFQAELEHERKDFTLDVFRSMANGGHWDYETLFVHLDFTPSVIQQLELTKADLTTCLKWLPSAISLSTLELYARGQCIGGELFTAEMYSELPGEEVEVGGMLVSEGREKSPKKKRKKKDKGDKKHKDKRKKKSKKKKASSEEEDDDRGDVSTE